MRLNRLLAPFVPVEADPVVAEFLGPWIPASAGMNGAWFNGSANLNSSRFRGVHALLRRAFAFIIR